VDDLPDGIIESDATGPTAEVIFGYDTRHRLVVEVRYANDFSTAGWHSFEVAGGFGLTWILWHRFPDHVETLLVVCGVVATGATLARCYWTDFF
jgi:hypothetical protein